jgi:uncharacterized protein YbjT (DUF2867 family)
MRNITQQDSPVLVTGATGNTGRVVVDALARQGVPVRAMVRAEADRGKLPAGVPAVIADFDDSASIAAALQGAEPAYLVTPSSERAVDVQDIAAVAAVTLTEAGHEGAMYTLTGPASITHTQIAGRPPRDVWQFARDYAPAFTG